MINKSPWTAYACYIRSLLDKSHSQEPELPSPTWVPQIRGWGYSALVQDILACEGSSLAAQKSGCHSKNLSPILLIQTPQMSGAFVHSLHTDHQIHQAGDHQVKTSTPLAGACSSHQGYHMKWWGPALLFRWLSFKISEPCAYECTSIARTSQNHRITDW